MGGITAAQAAAPSLTTAERALAGRPTNAKCDTVPVVVMAIENYGRIYGLLKAHVSVNLQMNVDTKFFGDHEHGYDTIAEIPVRCQSRQVVI